MLEKWKKAVIHLECATDSVHFYDRIKRMDEQRALLEKGEITQGEFGDAIASRSRDLRYHGTALFITHADRRYLLTARHMVWDEVAAKREFPEEVERASTWPENMQSHLVQSGVEQAKNRIFNMIFRVPSLNELLSRGVDSHREFLMNLGAGASFTAPYIFSTPELDLALISIDQRDSRFADQLIELGYVPISSEDIADGPSQEGSEVFTVGFPSPTALIGQVSQHSASAHWSSSHYSLPVFTFGRISLLHEALDFYWVDMSIFPGNSGGPVIEDGKLVGVVSAQAILQSDTAPDVRTRIPFGKIIKTKHVRELLNIQEQKDKR